MTEQIDDRETAGKAAPQTEGENPHAASVRKLARAMLRTGVVFGLVAVACGVAISAVLAGLPGVFGALVGGSVAFASSLATVAVMHKTAALPPELLFAVVLGGYALKIVALFAVMLAFSGAEALAPMALALTLLATIMAWAAAGLRAFGRTKILTVIPETPPEQATSSAK